MDQLLMTSAISLSVGVIAFVTSGPILSRWHPPGMSRATQWIRSRSDSIFILMVVAYLIFFTTLALLKFYTLQYYGGDLAQFDQVIWNSLHGRLFENTTIVDAPNALGKSFSPIWLAFVPLYAIWPNSLTLLLFALLAFVSAAFPIYWFARQRLGRLMALALALAFLLSPQVANLQSVGFYEITLAVPLLAYALFFLLNRNYKGFLVVLAVTLMVKEEVALITIAFGLFVILSQRNLRLGLALCAIGIGLTFLLLEVAIPYFRGTGFGTFYYFGSGSTRVIERYAYLGKDLGEVIATVVTKPDLVLQHVLIPAKFEYVLQFFVPLALTPLFGIDVLLIALPTFGYSLLSDNPWQHEIQQPYVAPLIPMFFFAAIAGAERLNRWIRRWLSRFSTPPSAAISGIKPALSAALVSSTVMTYCLLSPAPPGANFQPYIFTPTARSAVGLSLMSRIPMGVTVETLEEFEDKFSDRHYVYLMPEAPDYRQVDYLFGDTLRGSYRFHQVNWDFCLNTGYFETLSKEDGFILAKRREPDHPLGIQFSDQMKLLGYTIPLTTTLQGGVTLRPIVEWQAERVLTQTYRMSVELDDLAGHTWAAEDDEPDGGFTPTTGWLPGKPIGDQYALALPPTMPTGDYDLTLGVHDAAGTFLQAQDRAAHTLPQQAAIARIHIDKNKASFTANQLTIPVPMFVDMNEMRFLGFVPPRNTATPGDLLQVGLFWRARAKPQGDYEVAVQLRDAAGAVAFEQAARPANGTYPTTEWNAGEVLLDWHDFLISRDLLPGEYDVWVVLRDLVTGHVLGETQISQMMVVKP